MNRTSTKTTRLAALLVAAAALSAVLLVRSAPASATTAGACATQGPVGVAYAVGVNCRTVTLDGHPRRFIVYVPATAPVARPHKPVVFMFHGTGGDGDQFLRISGWREQADAAGHIAVFPNGLRYRVLESGLLKSKWNDFNLAEQIDRSELPPGSAPGSPVPADDVGFVDEIMGDLESQLAIDRRRIYASGFSNGAGFASRLAVDRSTKIAAAAYSGGGLPSVQSPERRVPTYITVGTLDAEVLERTDPPLTELPLDPLEILTNPTIGGFLDIALQTQGLDEDSFGVVSQPRSTKIRWPATGTGPGGALFRFGMLEDLVHRYPNGANNPNGFAAAPEFWEFFESHPLPYAPPPIGVSVLHREG